MTNGLSAAYEHSAWATNTTIDLAAGLAPEKLREPMDGVYSTVLRILTHLVDTERSFLAAVRGGASPGTVEEFADLDELRDAFAPVTRGWAELFAGSAAEGGDRGVFIPWFEREVPLQDVLTQVLLHSTQHRADVTLLMSMGGVEIPHMDFVLWRLGYLGGGGAS